MGASWRRRTAWKMSMKSGSILCLWRPRPRTLSGCLLLLLGWAPVSLLAQPISAFVSPSGTQAALGSSVTFCVTAIGQGPYGLQWQKNGVILPGQTNVCLTLTNIAVADGGSYRVAVFGGGAAVESDEGVLTLILTNLPGGDLFANSAAIAAVSNSVRGESFSATRETSEPQHSVTLNTSNSVWYVWRAPATGVVTFDTVGSTFDTLLAVYTGTYLGSLTQLASDDDSGGFHTSRVTWNAEAGVEYRVAIDGVTGETGGYVCNWNLLPGATPVPVLTLAPRSQTVAPGGIAVFTSAATNLTPGLSFQWFHNGALLPGETSSNLMVVNVTDADLGQYRVAVTNSAGGQAMSAPVDLEIGPRPDVQSKDKVAEVPSLGVGGGGGGGGGEFTASSIGGAAGTFSLAAGTIINQRFFSASTSDRCEPAHCGVAGGASRWFQLVAAADGVCTLDTQGSDVDTILAIYLQNFALCTNLFEPLVDCDNDAFGTCEQLLGPASGRERSSRVSFFAPSGTVYRAVVDSVGGVRGTNIQFNVHFQSPLSLPTNAIQLGAATNCSLQLRGSSLSLQLPPQMTAPSNVYQWQFKGRRIAGAARDRLLLPFLNYSDAGRYSVLVQSGTNRTQLPGVAVAVIDPCLSGTSGAAFTGEPLQLVGVAPEAVLLQAAPALNATSAWSVVGPILPSFEPTLWDVSTGSTRFYRVLRPPP